MISGSDMQTKKIEAVLEPFRDGMKEDVTKKTGRFRNMIVDLDYKKREDVVKVFQTFKAFKKGCEASLEARMQKLLDDLKKVVESIRGGSLGTGLASALRASSRSGRGTVRRRQTGPLPGSSSRSRAAAAALSMLGDDDDSDPDEDDRELLYSRLLRMITREKSHKHKASHRRHVSTTRRRFRHKSSAAALKSRRRRLRERRVAAARLRRRRTATRRHRSRSRGRSRRHRRSTYLDDSSYSTSTGSYSDSYLDSSDDDYDDDEGLTSSCQCCKSVAKEQQTIRYLTDALRGDRSSRASLIKRLEKSKHQQQLAKQPLKGILRKKETTADRLRIAAERARLARNLLV